MYFSGDKEHHVPVYHLSMPLHFFVIFSIILFPRVIHNFLRSFKINIFNIVGDSKDDKNNTSNDNDTTNDNNDNNNEKSNNDNDNNRNTWDNKNSGINIAVNRTDTTTATIRPATTSLHSSIYHCIYHSMGLFIVLLVLQYSCLSHPFLLADNR